jgi:hypothetical protein
VGTGADSPSIRRPRRARPVQSPTPRFASRRAIDLRRPAPESALHAPLTRQVSKLSGITSDSPVASLTSQISRESKERPPVSIVPLHPGSRPPDPRPDGRKRAVRRGLQSDPNGPSLLAGRRVASRRSAHPSFSSSLLRTRFTSRSLIRSRFFPDEPRLFKKKPPRTRGGDNHTVDDRGSDQAVLPNGTVMAACSG